VSCNPACISCGCFAVPLWVRRWLLFYQNKGEQYSDTTDSQSQHIGRGVGLVPTEYWLICRMTYQLILGRHVRRLSVGVLAESVDRQRSLLHMIQFLPLWEVELRRHLIVF